MSTRIQCARAPFPWRVAAAALALLADSGLGGRAARADANPFPVSAALEAEAGSGRRLIVRVAVPSNGMLYADAFAVEAEPPARLAPLALPDAERHRDPFSGKDRQVFTRDLTAVYAVEPPGDWPVTVTVRREGCDQTVCFLPQSDTLTLTGGPPSAPSGGAVDGGAAPAGDWAALRARVTVLSSRAGYLAPEPFLSFLEDAGPGAGRPAGTRPLWLVLVAIVLGGLALNLTPCVLPMIPINLAIIGAGSGGQSGRRGLFLGALYGAGMALAYGLLGVLVVLSGATFGAINASPWFNLGVAVLFAVLALSLFDVWTLDFSRWQPRAASVRAGGGALAILLLGALSAVLAGACVAPVVLSVLLLATDLYARGRLAGLLLPFLLGLGMAAPWPAAGAGLALLPRPGRWMQRVKAGFGVLILAAAAWYGYTGLRLAWPRPPAPAVPAGWMDNVPQALAESARNGRPVLLYFWASWCKNCHAMEATTFRDPRVRQRLDAFVKVKVQAERPNQSPDRERLQAFGVLGLPTYLVLKPVVGPP